MLLWGSADTLDSHGDLHRGIYRRSRKRSRVLVGTVETAGEEGKRAFSNVEELWEILEHHVGPSSSAPPESRDDAGKEV